ncbi:protein AKNAD1 [Microcebus murinus]|uniref:protein AKNAD1 n=1 Tax=Microcebus murinus TaxID=30608 RepID=UPI0006435B38|nr:protein AKNAD1 [Microcebus murinus]
MDDDLSEDTTCKQQEELPYDGADYAFTSENGILDGSDQVILIADGPQEEATHDKPCRNTAKAMPPGYITENPVNKKHDQEKQCAAVTPNIPADQGDTSNSNISDILLHHLSEEKFLSGQGIDCETPPETSNTDSFEEGAIIENIISCYIKNSCPEEQTSKLTDQLNHKRDDENSNEHGCSLNMIEENTSDLEEPVAAGDSSHPEDSNFLTKIKGPSDEQKRCQGQSPQNEQTGKASSGSRFKCCQGHAHYQRPDFSKAVPKVKIPKNDIVNKPLTIAKQANFSPKLRSKSAMVQDTLETMPKSNCVETQHQEQKGKITEPSQQLQMEPTVCNHQELLTGIESETSLLKVSSTLQKDPSSNSSNIFQKICQGKQMCKKLKEQTDQLQTKVQEFSKRIKQDSSCHVQDKRMVLKHLQGHLELLEQKFLATKDTHLALQQHTHEHKSATVGDFDPERKVEGEIFKLEILLEDVKQKIDESKNTSALSLPASSPGIPDGLISTSSSLSNEEDLCGTLGTRQHAETTAPSLSCAFCRQLLEWKQKMEKKGHRRINLGGFSIVLEEKTLCLDSTLSSNKGHGFCSDPGTERQGSKCEDCGTKIPNSRRVCSQEPLKEFHYRYNTPGQNYLNHSKRGAFLQLCSLDESKTSSPSRSKPKRICSQRVNSKSFQGEHEPTAGKKNLQAFVAYSSDSSIPSSHLNSSMISGRKSLCDFDSTEETKSEVLNVALDHALKTATNLKETTDQMITTIAEDLAKAQKWRNRLKH